MAIVTRHSDRKIRNNVAGQGMTVVLIGYSNIHEKDVYYFLNFAGKRTIFSGDVIWLNMT
jgi:hypothetical protein